MTIEELIKKIKFGVTYQKKYGDPGSCVWCYWNGYIEALVEIIKTHYLYDDVEIHHEGDEIKVVLYKNITKEY